MLIAVIGGKLQGLEAIYLAKKAGWKTLLIDKNKNAPASKLCDYFLEFEFSKENSIPPDLIIYNSILSCIPCIDIILPAVEDPEVLHLLLDWSQAKNIALAFDPGAYAISSSKIESDRLFQEMNLPIPQPWPGCKFPVMIKPDNESGSRGIKIVENQTELSNQLKNSSFSENMVIQEFVDGPSYSIEVIGKPGYYHAFQVTELGMDKNWDCNQVKAPADLPENKAIEFKKTAIAIAEKIQLNGIMDLEAIYHNNELKLLEIDARLPSQTPMTVYFSTGINMVEILINQVLNRKIKTKIKFEQPVWIEHIKVTGSQIEFPGEHLMAQDGPLILKPKFLGTDEALTSFHKNKHKWVATMIFTGLSFDEIKGKRDLCYKNIRACQHRISRKQPETGIKK
ncbi:3-methylornithine--L-lysine ligase PylC [Desulfobacterales bacterium HSG17]|nr:3-methylornithine--L-lysine ligase PylC [Desulfobacterales bacterium HSG17]